ncbi:PDDEXK nuclease domain-containing protein [Treponema primitia]|uniref:PDDEXK nuclease domain-containing protein n=1 Tax=Treponema primitia TaxID=88058 RepID=UPI00397F64A5
MNNSQLSFIASIKEKIRLAQYEALKAVNTHLINLYWDIGKDISGKQAESWGKSIVPVLSSELQKEFPGISGFSVSNLWYMAQFYSEYHDVEFLEPLVREISWSKHIAIMKKCKDTQERRFYIMATKKFGWSKNVLINQIGNKTYEKYLLGQTNYNTTLPENIRKQAILAVKDEYTFDFLDLADEHSERELESALMNNIRSFLLEMGNQFAFIGNQFKIKAGKKEYFIDLLLYHRSLHCLVAVELKIGEFQPEYKGKMEFYLTILNEKIKLSDENDSIGIIICKEKDRTIVEYSLRTSPMPIGVATYTTSPKLPKDYKKLLPDSKAIGEKIDAFFEINEDHENAKE